MIRKAISALIVSIYSLLPLVAEAHGTIPGIGTFYSGLLHPLLIPVHMLILVGLAILTTRQETFRSILVPFFGAFVPALILSCFLSSFEMPVPLMLSLALIIGVTAATGRALPVKAAILYAIMAGIFIGLDSSPGVTGIKTITGIASGTAFGVFLILINIAFYLSLLKKDWMKIGLRVMGSWIAASAILVLALSFRS